MCLLISHTAGYGVISLRQYAGYCFLLNMPLWFVERKKILRIFRVGFYKPVNRYIRTAYCNAVANRHLYAGYKALRKHLAFPAKLFHLPMGFQVAAFFPCQLIILLRLLKIENSNTKQ